MKIKPLHDRIFVKRAEAEGVSAGGIVIPESAKRKTLHGEVLAMGTGRRLDNGGIRPLDVKVGDVVYFRGTSGQEVDLDDDVYVMLREDEIEAVRV